MTKNRNTLASSGRTQATTLQGIVYAGLVVLSLYGLARALGITFDQPYKMLALLCGALSFFLFRGLDLATPWHTGATVTIGTRFLWSWAGFISALLFLAYATQYSEYFSRRLLLVWTFVTPVLLISVHWLIHYVVTHHLPDLAVRRSAVIVFVNETARQLSANLKASPLYDLVGYFDDREVERIGGGLPEAQYRGRAKDAVTYIKQNGVQVVFVVLPGEGFRRGLTFLDNLGDTTASVYFVPDLFIFNMLQGRIREIEGVPVLEVAETPFYGVDGMFKQIFDMVVAALIVLAISPVLLLLALLVKLTSPGPAIFQQKRYGLNGEVIHVYKFRSMFTGNEQDREKVQATREDPRITPLGRILRRTSLDELPQFFNVLKGDMSVVGPRPHSVAHNEQYRKEVKRYMLRHKVKPGITGWAQVHGLRGETAQVERMEDRIRFDLEYIRNWSPWLDLKIILKTVWVVFTDKNAY